MCSILQPVETHRGCCSVTGSPSRAGSDLLALTWKRTTIAELCSYSKNSDAVTEFRKIPGTLLWMQEMLRTDIKTEEKMWSGCGSLWGVREAASVGSGRSFPQRWRQGWGFSMSIHLGLRFNNEIWASNSLGKTHSFTILYISRTQRRIFPLDIWNSALKNFLPADPAASEDPLQDWDDKAVTVLVSPPTDGGSENCNVINKDRLRGRSCGNLAYIGGDGSESSIHSLLRGGRFSHFKPSWGPNLWRA